MVLALFLYRPATLRHSSTWCGLAFASTSGVIVNLLERFSKAFVVFLSAVFCEIIVRINVSKGSRFDVIHVGIVNAALSVVKMRSARFSAILIVSPLENNK